MKKFNTDQPGFDLEHFVLPTGEVGAQAIALEASDQTFKPARYDARRSFYRNGGKRIFETVLILLSLPFFLPIVALCALIVCLDGRNPFYRQDRLGKNGKRFSILKLRTMVYNADEVLEDHLASDPAIRREWDDKQKLMNDPRVTPIGHFLRSSSVDELPQLWNVLTGEMSLIGPRPMMPEQLPMYGNPVDYFSLRPGITGLWQISSRNEESFSSRNHFDTTYRNELSFAGDVSIIFKTVDVMLRRTGR